VVEGELFALLAGQPVITLTTVELVLLDPVMQRLTAATQALSDIL
jgi:hypothetical protein